MDTKEITPFENFCLYCYHYDPSSGVCSEIHENVRNYPKTITSKCNGELFKDDPNKITDEDKEVSNSDESSFIEEKEVSAQQTIQLNKVVNVTLVGGIIGLIGVRPNNALNSRIKKENANGWKVIQVIPSSSGNLLLSLLRVVLLIITLFLYTTADGYYVIMERIDNE